MLILFNCPTLKTRPAGTLMVAPGRADQATVWVKPPPVIFTAVGIVITGEKRTCDNENLSESSTARATS